MRAPRVCRQVGTVALVAVLSALCGCGRSPAPPAGAPAGAVVPWTEAARHVGQTVTVEGPVAAVRFVGTTGGQPTFIDLGR